MKIDHVKANNRKRCFVVSAGGKSWELPYANLQPVPERGNGVVQVASDPDFGHEAFTYTLKDGSEGSVHLDQVLEVNRDPEYMAELLLHKLNLEVERRVAASKMSKREMVRRLGTSATQFYRLLDTANTRKSMGQLLQLLSLLGCEVDFVVRERSSRYGEE